MTTPEAALKKKIKDWLENIGAYWVVVQGGIYSKPGDPDIISCVPSPDGLGLFVAIEAKTPTGVQSPIQKKRQAQIEASGGIYILARDLDDVVVAVESLGYKEAEE